MGGGAVLCREDRSSRVRPAIVRLPGPPWARFAPTDPRWAGKVAANEPAGSFRLLVFTRTTGYRHQSIPAGVAALRELGSEHDFTVEVSDEPGVFRERNLAGFAAVAFLSTSGNVMDRTGKADLEHFVKAGGGFVGIHSAAATEYEWPFFGTLLGARFESHPPVQQGTIHVVDRQHPATRDLEPVWARTDEWYNFRTNPREDVRVLATVDEATYSGGTMGADHPISWCHRNAGGRAFYTGICHTAQSYAEPTVRRHLLGGIRYVAVGSPPTAPG